MLKFKVEIEAEDTKNVVAALADLVLNLRNFEKLNLKKVSQKQTNIL